MKWNNIYVEGNEITIKKILEFVRPYIGDGVNSVEIYFKPKEDDFLGVDD